MNRQLVRLGAKQITGDTDEIADVQKLVKRKIGFANFVEARVDLEAMAATGNIRKSGLALSAHRHQATADANLDALCIQLLFRPALIGIQNLRKGMTEVITMRISGVAELLDLFELRVALSDQVGFLILLQGFSPR